MAPGFHGPQGGPGPLELAAESARVSCPVGMLCPLCVQPGALLSWPGLPGEKVNPSSLEQTLRALVIGLMADGAGVAAGHVWPAWWCLAPSAVPVPAEKEPPCAIFSWLCKDPRCHLTEM